jgi:hypothetical protein
MFGGQDEAHRFSFRKPFAAKLSPVAPPVERRVIMPARRAFGRRMKRRRMLVVHYDGSDDSYWWGGAGGGGVVRGLLSSTSSSLALLRISSRSLANPCVESSVDAVLNAAGTSTMMNANTSCNRGQKQAASRHDTNMTHHVRSESEVKEREQESTRPWPRERMLRA